MVKVNGKLNLKSSSSDNAVEGDLFYDPTSKKLKLHNGTEVTSVSEEVDLSPVNNMIAEQAMQLTTLNYTNSIADIPHDFIQVDVFTNECGYNNTINIENTSSVFDNDYYRNKCVPQCHTNYDASTTCVYESTNQWDHWTTNTCGGEVVNSCDYTLQCLKTQSNPINDEYTYMWNCKCINICLKDCVREYYICTLNCHYADQDANYITVCSKNIFYITDGTTRCEFLNNTLCYIDSSGHCERTIDATMCIVKTGTNLCYYCNGEGLFEVDESFNKIESYTCNYHCARCNADVYVYTKNWIFTTIDGYIDTKIQSNVKNYGSEVNTIYLDYDGVLENNTSIDIDIYDYTCGLLCSGANLKESINIPSNTGELYFDFNQKITNDLNKSCIKSYAILTSK